MLDWCDDCGGAALRTEDSFECFGCGQKDERNALREAWLFALNEWFDRIYPPDIFVGGPSSDPGVNEVREVAEKLRTALGDNA
jgi:hypothetical protein